MGNEKEVAAGVAHRVPEDLKEVLLDNEELLSRWNKLTALSRNEWICWIISVKKEETRIEHIKRLEEEVLAGKKRPCCWPGCPHREKGR